MSSQDDIFGTQTQTPTRTQTQNETQADTKKKKIKYGYVVLCDKGDDVKKPFSLHQRSLFSKEIPEKWLDSILDHSSRLKSIQSVSKIEYRNLSLFGKIDEGK